MYASVSRTAAIAALLSASTANAEVLSTCASGASDVCYALGVPDTTASATTGNLYLQITAPTSYSWVALGTGSGMSGSNMFIMYSDGNGNVTVSSRQGRGEVQPQYSASTASDLQLMEGSGVVNGQMVANLLCTDCKSWNGGSLSTSSTSAPFVGAWKSGSALDSSDPAQSISIHDGHTEFEIDLTQAVLAEDANPFTGAAATTPTTGSGTGSSGVTQSAGPNKKVIWAHGIGMAVVFAILYPLGSALMPLVGKWWLHAGWQGTAWLGMWAFFALGVVGAQQRDLLFNNTHTLLGTVVVCLLAVQPALGQLHHRYFSKQGSRGIFSYAHLWWGRSLIILGAINAGLGMQLSHSDTKWIIAYSVVAVVVYVIYAAIKTFTVMKRGSGLRSIGSGGKGSPRARSSHGDEMPMNMYGETRFVEHDHGKR